jgi:hypothetical protein
MFTYTVGMFTNEKETQLLSGLGTLVGPNVLERDAKFRLIPLLPSEPLQRGQRTRIVKGQDSERGRKTEDASC